MAAPNWTHIFSGPSMAEVFLQARDSATRQRRVDLEERKFKAAQGEKELALKHQEAVQKARLSAIDTGDFAPLQAIDPEGAGSIIDQQGDIQGAAKVQREEDIAKKLDGAEMVRSLLESNRTDDGYDLQGLVRGMHPIRKAAASGSIHKDVEQSALDAITGILNTQGPAGSDHSALEALHSDMDNTIAAFGDPEARERFQSDAEKVAAMVAAKTGDSAAVDYKYAVEKHAQAVRDAWAQVQAERKGVAKASASRVTVDAVPNQPGTIADKSRNKTLLQELGGMDKARGKIQLLRKVITDKATGEVRDDLFGFQAAAKGMAAKGLSYFAGGNAPDWAREYMRVRQWLRGVGRRYVLALLTSESGKQVTDKERDFLLKAVGDPDNMTRDEYVAALDSMEALMDIDEGIVERELREGRDYLPDDIRTEHNARLDAVYKKLRENEITDEDFREQILEIQKDIKQASSANQMRFDDAAAAAAKQFSGE